MIRAAVLVALAFCVFGCGQKGPLKLPEPVKPADSATPSDPAKSADPARPAAPK